MSELPKGWVEAKLEDVAKWSSGGTPSRSKSEYYSDEIPWIKTGDLNDSIVEDASEYISELGLKNSSAKLFPKGSIGIAMYGATIGKTGVFGLSAATNQACAVAVPNGAIVPSFLHSYLKFQKPVFIEKGKGGAQPNISQGVIKEHPIPLPPLAEQERIVEKLDALFASLDVIKDKLDRIPELLKNFRQQVLTQAVTGKLTEEWREKKDIEEFKKFYQELEKFHLSKKKPVKVRGQKGIANEVIFEVPDYWKWIPNYYLVKDGGNAICAGPFGTIFKAKDFRDSGVPIIFLRHVKPFNFNQEKPNYMEPTVWKKLHQEYSIYGGEMLITKLGDPPGDAAIYPKDAGVSMVTPDVMKADYNEHFILPEFAAYYFNSRACKEIISEISFGMTRLRIDLTMFKSFPIPIPSLEEQQEIVRRVEELFAIADRVEAQYTSLKEKVDKLPQAILAKAFRGELVDQHKGDESAEVLLERIRSESQIKKMTQKTRI